MSNDQRTRWRAGATALRALTLAGAILAVPGEPATARGAAARPPVLGMAVPLPDPGMANAAPGRMPAAGDSPRVPPEPAAAPVLAPPAPRRLPGPSGTFPTEGGRLPNQRTGHRHEHVVRDICIGC